MNEIPKRVDQLSSSPSDSVKHEQIDWRNGRNQITKPSGAKASFPDTKFGAAPVAIERGK